jgi:hypothetical protein
VAEPRLGGELVKALTTDLIRLFAFPFPNTAQLLVAWALDGYGDNLWSSGQHVGPQILTPEGSRYSASRAADGLIRVDTAMMPSAGLGHGSMMTIRGKVRRGDSWTRDHVMAGDPVAVLLHRDSAHGSRSGGILLPARYGESFELMAPTGPYWLSAYAIDRHGTSLHANSSVRALGVQHLGDNKTIFGREKVELVGRPSLANSRYRPRSNSTALVSAAPFRERIRLTDQSGSPPRRASTKPEVRTGRCEAELSGGRCGQEVAAGYIVCRAHLLAAVKGRTVRSITSGRTLYPRCSAQFKNGEHCKGEAVIAVDAPHIRVYCYKHVDMIERELGRCRALTRAGQRCANSVSAKSKLCYTHNTASGTVRHYATSRVVYENR